MNTERRVNPRVPYAKVVEMIADGDRNISANCINLSRAGILCSSATPLSLKTDVYLELVLPLPSRDVLISCNAKVSRSIEQKGLHLCAILFNDLSPESAAALDEFILSEWKSELTSYSE